MTKPLHPLPNRRSPPRVDTHHEAIVLPLDYSFFQVKTPMEVLLFPPRIESPLGLKCPKDHDGKWLTTALKLNNNIIDNLDNLSHVMESLFPHSQWLTWLDLSSNQLTKVPPELIQLKTLKILYLHGNRIATTKELVKLQPLTHLTKLTAHGNPAELEQGYFVVLLAAFPNLVKLDFTAVSINDKLAAEQLRLREMRPRHRMD